MKRTKEIAKEISVIAPTYLRHIFPYVLKAIDLPPSQLIALVTLHEREQCTLGVLSKEMHVSAPTITGIVDRMEKGGYVKRLPDKEDRRITNVTMTKKGHEKVHKFLENIRKRWEIILLKMPNDDQETWLRIFRGITERLSIDAD